MGQTKQWLWPFYGASLALGNALELFLSPTTELVISSCRLKSTFWCTSTIQSRNGSLMYYRIREDNTSKWWSIWFAVSSRGTCLPELFHLSNFLQMPNDCTMVNVELFSNFSCSCKRICFNIDLNWSLSVSSGQPLCSSSSRLSSSLWNLLNHHGLYIC